jgi:hypothetical protein
LYIGTKKNQARFAHVDSDKRILTPMRTHGNKNARRNGVAPKTKETVMTNLGPDTVPVGTFHACTPFRTLPVAPDR